MALCSLWTTDLIYLKFNCNTIHININIWPYNSTLLCGQVVSIGGQNHPVSHSKHLIHQTSPGNIYVKSGK